MLITAYVIFVDDISYKLSFYFEFSSNSDDDIKMHHTLDKPLRL